MVLGVWIKNVYQLLTTVLKLLDNIFKNNLIFFCVLNIELKIAYLKKKN